MTTLRENKDVVWNAVWENEPADEHSVRWSVARDLAIMGWPTFVGAAGALLGNLRGLSSIELGAGRGVVSLQLARLGVDVTLVDWSERALDVAAQLYRREGCCPRLLRANILDLPASARGQYDLSVSVGVAEHFVGRDRVAVIRAHSDVLKPGGVTLISVPNARCIPYRVAKYFAEVRGKWMFGLEVPFSRSELFTLAFDSDLQVIDINGSPLIEATSHWLIRPYGAALLERLSCGRLKITRKSAPLGQLRWQTAKYVRTPFDRRFGYLLNMIASRRIKSRDVR